ncbi:DNA replication complex GINS protein PSF2 isoform X2 [Numida meleagris]|uniref:DNA replication complex GINS protein PSF2 isoform X2 n=1 Tax=Numida meleagris TaxID=8996 RepID=UPI000B3DA26C|nr:DNA replication complex GINS protein PSF2 isoform X2 [Numida meleagris]
MLLVASQGRGARVCEQELREAREGNSDAIQFRLFKIPWKFMPSRRGGDHGDLGPFNPGLPVEVPVWLAINLKQRQKCRLIPPEWMDVEKLEEIRDLERKEDTFTPMPSPYYMELTKLLLNYASDNIPKADEIRTLVKDTWDTRMAKLRLSADSFVRQQEAHAKLDNLTLMEINTIGTFLTQALDHMYKLRTNLQPAGSAESQDF